MPEIRDGGPIPDGLMREARPAARAIVQRPTMTTVAEAAEIIGHALMAARKDERERAARIARSMAEIPLRSPSDTLETMLKSAMDRTGLAIADAILSYPEQSNAE